MKRELLRDKEDDGTGGGAGGPGKKWTEPDNKTNDKGEPNSGRTPAEIETDRVAEVARIAAAGAGGVGDPYKPVNELWTELQKVEGFKMPDGITKDNETELLKKALVDNKLAEVDPGQSATEKLAAETLEKEKNKYSGMDPEAAAFMKYKEVNPTATLSDFVKQRNKISELVSLPDKEFMKEHLISQYGLYDKEKNPDGLSEQEITDAIDALETNKQLPLEAKRLKAEYRKVDIEARSKETTGIDVAGKEKVDKIVTDMKTDLQKLFVDTDKITEISGIKISKAEIADINTAFEKAVLPNKEGKVQITEMLQSDRLLWNFFATAYLGDEKFKEAFTTAKETTKDKIIEKLGLKPINVSGRQSDTGKKNTITPGLWSIPEQAK